MKLAKRSRIKFLRESLAEKYFEIIILNIKKDHKYKFFVQPGDRIATQTTLKGLFEIYEIESINYIIDKFIKPRFSNKNMIALDIGANIGAYSVSLADRFDRILAFEPNPYIYSVLEANLRVNGVRNVQSYQVALGEADDTLELYKNEEWNIGMASLTKLHAEAPVISSVSVLRGDEFIAPLLGADDALAFVKIDVEGHEGKVIAGLKTILSQHKPLISLEIRGGEQGKALRDELAEIGYRNFYWIERRKSSAVATKFRRVVDLAMLGADFHLQPLDGLEDTFYACVLVTPDDILAGA